MAYLNICGFETGNLSEVTLIGGTATMSAQSTTKRTGSYAFQFNSSAQFGAYGVQKLAANGTPALIGRSGASTTYYTFYVRFATLPATNVDFASVQQSGSTQVVGLMVNSSGTFTITGGTTSATIATFSTGVWYRIDLRVTSNGTSVCSVDGGTSQSCNSTNVTQDYLYLGCWGASPTMNVFYDDIAISDSAQPGAGQVNILKPNATGNYTAWTDGAGTAPTNVAEVPHTSDTGYITSSTSGQAETEAMDSAATGGVVGTIGTVKAVAIVRDEGGASSLSVRLRSNTTDSDTTAVDPGSSYTPLCKLFDTDPATSTAWTSSGIDGLEVGVVNAASVAVRATAIYAMVWCTGQVTYTGTGSLTVPIQTVSGSGKQTQSGTSALSVPKQTLSGTGKQSAIGTGALRVPVQVIAGSGTYTPTAATGTGTITVPMQTLAGVGKAPYVGTGTLTIPIQTLTGSGKQSYIATGAFTVPVQVLAASGKQTMQGTGALTLPMMLVSGSGKQSYIGTGALTLPMQVVDASGHMTFTGTGTLAIPMLVLSGVAQITLPPLILCEFVLGIPQYTSQLIVPSYAEELTVPNYNGKLIIPAEELVHNLSSMAEVRSVRGN